MMANGLIPQGPQNRTVCSALFCICVHSKKDVNFASEGNCPADLWSRPTGSLHHSQLCRTRESIKVMLVMMRCVYVWMFASTHTHTSTQKWPQRFAVSNWSVHPIANKFHQHQWGWSVQPGCRTERNNTWESGRYTLPSWRAKRLFYKSQPFW